MNVSFPEGRATDGSPSMVVPHGRNMPDVPSIPLRLGRAMVVLIVCAFSPFAGFLNAAKKEKVREEVATVDTNLGNFSFRFFTRESPKTVEAFKKLARAGFYDGLLVHRVLPGLLIQTGDPGTKEEPPDAQVLPVEAVPTEKNELKHHSGTVSMAREKDDPNSRSEFFIVLQEAAFFDGKNTVIGEILSGLKVVEAISNVPRNLKQLPLRPVRIRRIHLEVQEFFKEVK